MRLQRCVYKYVPVGRYNHSDGKPRNRRSPVVFEFIWCPKNKDFRHVPLYWPEHERQRFPMPRSMAESEARLASTSRCRGTSVAGGCRSIRTLHRTEAGNPGSVADVANPRSNTTNWKSQTKTIACDYDLITVACYLCNTRPKTRCSSPI